MIAETDDSFTMHDGSSPFKVPKKGLSKTLEARIRSMSVDPQSVKAAAPDGGQITFGEPVRKFEPVQLNTPPAFATPLGMSPDERPVTINRGAGGGDARAGGASATEPAYYYAADGAPGGAGGAGGGPTPQKLFSPTRGGWVPDVGQGVVMDERPSASPYAGTGGVTGPSPAYYTAEGTPPASGAGGGPGMASPQTVFDSTRGGNVPDVGQGAQGGGHAPPPELGSRRVADMAGLPPDLRLKGAGAPPGPTSPPRSTARAIARPGGAGTPQVMPGMASIQGGIEQQKGANVMAAQARGEEGRQTADALSGFQRQLEANALEDKARVDASNARTAETMTRFKAAQDEMTNINTTVDPGRYWASRSTGGKITAIIGLALGALGAGPDGVNKAAVMLNQAIDRDLEAQKSEHTLRLQKGQQAVNAASSAYAMEHQRFGDESAASAAAKANLLSLAQNKLAQITAGSANPAAAAQAQQLNGALETQKGELEQKAANDLATRNHANAAAAAARAAGAKGTGLSTPEQSKVFEVQTTTQNIKDNLAKAKDLIRRKGTFELTGTEQTELQRALHFVAQDTARLADPGSTVKDAELENAKKAIGVNGGEIFSLSNATALKLLESFESGVEQRQQTALAVRGLGASPTAKQIEGKSK